VIGAFGSDLNPSAAATFDKVDHTMSRSWAEKPNRYDDKQRQPPMRMAVDPKAETTS
jgi:hypothetical protein